MSIIYPRESIGADVTVFGCEQRRETMSCMWEIQVWPQLVTAAGVNFTRARAHGLGPVNTFDLCGLKLGSIPEELTQSGDGITRFELYQSAMTPIFVVACRARLYSLANNSMSSKWIFVPWSSRNPIGCRFYLPSWALKSIRIFTPLLVIRGIKISGGLSSYMEPELVGETREK